MTIKATLRQHHFGKKKTSKTNTCIVLIRIIITFANQTFLSLTVGSRNMISFKKYEL